MSTEDIVVKSPADQARRRASTKATLLSAMEGAGKMVDDEELRAAMAERGLAPSHRARRSSKA